MAEGFLAVDKVSGWTSHDVVAKVRGLLGERRVGHGGTLDPAATGLLMLGVGRATRLLRFVQALPKEYLARVVFGVATDSLDAQGAILSREPLPISEEDLEAVLGRFVGLIMQAPPMVSAVRVDGRRLYELAREGRTVDREERPVRVDELEVLDFAPGDYPEATIRVVCGKGTYIRVLADDLARALGGHAHLSSLRRVRLGSFSADAEARMIEELEELSRRGRIEEALLNPAEGLRDLPAVSVGPEREKGVRNGMVFAPGVLGEPEGDAPFRVLDSRGGLAAVYRKKGKGVAPAVVLA